MLIRTILGLPDGTNLPQILLDGDLDAKKLVNGTPPPPLRTCVDEPGVSFASLDFFGGFAHPTTDPSGFRCTLDRLPAVSVEGIDSAPGPLPASLPPSLPPPGESSDSETRCRVDGGSGVNFDPEDATCNLLSSYRFFRDGTRQVPSPGVVPYDLNTALFADEAAKHRFVCVPPGTQAHYDAMLSFEFPVGTVILKTFTYPVNARDPSKGERRLETCLLIHRSARRRAI